MKIHKIMTPVVVDVRQRRSEVSKTARQGYGKRLPNKLKVWKGFQPQCNGQKMYKECRRTCIKIILDEARVVGVV